MASEETSANVSSRVSKAMEQLAQKAEMQKLEKQQKQQELAVKQQQEQEALELEQIKQARIERMKKEKAMLEEERNLGKGHGELLHITEPEFLDTVLKSYRCCIMFFHRDFQTSAIVESRLTTLAVKHPECRFAKIDAEKAPFFVSKLAIRILPCIVCFEDGKVIGKKLGVNSETEDESLREIESALLQIGVIGDRKILNTVGKDNDREDEDDDEMENLAAKFQTTRLVKSKVKDDGDW